MTLTFNPQRKYTILLHAAGRPSHGYTTGIVHGQFGEVWSYDL